MKTNQSFILFALLLVAGCATRLENTPERPSPYNGDKVLFRADQTILTSYKLLNDFVTWEKNFRPLINDVKVKHAADRVRLHAKDWIASVIRCRDAYRLNPQEGVNQDKLYAALNVIDQALVEALNYMAAFTKKEPI